MPHVPSFVPVSRERHGEQRWRPPTDWRFAAERILAPLALAEIPRAALSLPIGLLREDGQVTPIALLGFELGRNLLVDEAGRWLGPYVPAAFRGHPFALGAIESSSNLALCVDEGGDSVAEDAAEAFFEADGELAPKLSAVFGFLKATWASLEAARNAAARLDAAGLLEPWPIVVRKAEGDITITGINRIAEAKLGETDAETLRRLAAAGDLSLAYCQLLSMQHLPRLGELHQHHAAAAERLARTMKAALTVEEPLAFDWSSLATPDSGH
jgi:hypothetical protein